MKNLRLFICFLFLSAVARGQQFIFNINKENGLPVNHVYGTAIDKYHYLWIATPKGVVRYNGYTAVLFDMSDGLPTDDVWYLKGDKKGRVWINSITNELGYIARDQYYPKIISPPGNELFPKDMQLLRNGITFITPISYHYEREKKCLYAIAEDTAVQLELGPYGQHLSFMNAAGELIADSGKHFYSLRIENQRIVRKRLNPYDPEKTVRVSGGMHYNLFGRFLYTFRYKDTSIGFIRLADTGAISRVNLFEKGEFLTYVFHQEEKLYVNSNRNIYVLDTTLRLTGKYRIGSLVNQEIDFTKPAVLAEYPLWGSVLGTTAGLFVNFPVNDAFRKISREELSGYEPLRCINDSTCYWWNNTTETLAEQTGTGIRHYRLEGIKDIVGINPYSREQSLLLTGADIFLMDHATKKLQPFSGTHALQSPADAIAIDDSTIIGIYYGVKGLHKHRRRANSGVTLYRQTFAGMSYDSVRKGIWVFNKNAVLFYSIPRKDILVFNRGHLQKLGIRSVENVIPDSKSGVIYVKDYDKIWQVDPLKRVIRPVFNYLNFKGSLIGIHNRTLIVVGRFGVLFSHLRPDGSLSPPHLYNNIKNIRYNIVYGYLAALGSVIFHTDKGIYQIGIPAGTDSNSKVPYTGPKYRLLASYGEEVQDLSRYDTLNIQQHISSINLDIINPMGNGMLQFRYRIKGLQPDWKQLPGRILLLPQLRPGNYYQAEIAASDEAWNSKKHVVIIYRIPRWYQTNIWKAVFLVGGIIILVFSGFAISAITRRRVIKNANKKAYRMELELKAIYSQINPHFIFNTLGTALYFIKLNKTSAAYEHITRFSRLLRNYLNASRSRVVSLADELSNIKDYIELQQSRFVDKFSYDIRVDDNISTAGIQIPSLLLQPLVENAINHGLLNKESKGQLNVMVTASDLPAFDICVTIEDDGVGRAQAKEIRDESSIRPSYGTILIEELTEFFNTYSKGKIILNYLDKQLPQTGTIVKVYIKGS